MRVSKIALCCILIAVMVFMLCGCSAKKIDWKLQGAWVTGDGEVMESMELSISGKITMDESGVDTLDLDIRLPDSFRYSFNDIPTLTSHSRKYFSLPYCVVQSYTYDKVANDPVFSCFAISLEKEYAIFNWEDGSDLYLIAAKEPISDPQTILTYFKGFIEEYKIDD